MSQHTFTYWTKQVRFGVRYYARCTACGFTAWNETKTGLQMDVKAHQTLHPRRTP